MDCGARDDRRSIVRDVAFVRRAVDGAGACGKGEVRGISYTEGFSVERDERGSRGNWADAGPSPSSTPTQSMGGW